jgi:hypothetical protein
LSLDAAPVIITLAVQEAAVLSATIIQAAPCQVVASAQVVAVSGSPQSFPRIHGVLGAGLRGYVLTARTGQKTHRASLED